MAKVGACVAGFTSATYAVTSYDDYPIVIGGKQSIDPVCEEHVKAITQISLGTQALTGQNVDLSEQHVKEVIEETVVKECQLSGLRLTIQKP